MILSQAQAFEADSPGHLQQESYTVGADTVAPVVDVLKRHLLTDQYANWARDLNWPALKAFYSKREFLPIWLQNGRPSPRATMLRDTLLAAYTEGLDPREYHTPAIRYMWRARRPITRARLELLLSDAFLRYAQEVGAGYYAPKAADFDWKLPPKVLNTLDLLEFYLTTDLPAMFLTYLAPQHEAYQQLKAALARYRAMVKQGGWVKISPGKSLQFGDSGRRVLQLRQRLVAEGYLEPVGDDSFPMIFDSALERAVRRYQANHGHKVDGIVGWFTLQSLNVSLKQRIATLKKNMERWRWLPDNLGDHYVWVNMAAYELSLVDQYREVLNMPVVIGKLQRATPSFADIMEYIEFNPTWNVPPRIAKEKFLPKLQKNPDFLKANHLQVYDSWQKNAKLLDPETIKWQHYSSDRWFPYKLVQTAGKHNSLGRIKFMFPNKYRIYLHDTPEKALFDRYVRTFSAGCIRVAKPYLLAEKILAGQGDWTMAKIRKTVKEAKTRQVRLHRKWPVYLFYWTAWVDKDGFVNFRRDVYRRNTLIAAGSEPDYAKLVLAQGESRATIH